MDNNTRYALKMLKEIINKQQEQINKLLKDCSKNNLLQRLESLEKSCQELRCKCDNEYCHRLNNLEVSCLELRCKFDNNAKCCEDIKNCCTENSEYSIKNKNCCIENTCDNSVVDAVLNN